MAWRMLMRRCPTRSMTIVGDMAQASELGGGTSWQEVLGPNLADRWRLERLTINYRTPAEIAEVAADVLAAIDPELHPPRPVRETGIAPWHAQAPPGELGGMLGDLAREKKIAFEAQTVDSNPEIRAIFQREIDAYNVDKPHHEQIRAFALLPSDLTVEDGSITPTLKVKRRILESRYQSLIQKMYQAAERPHVA